MQSLVQILIFKAIEPLSCLVLVTGPRKIGTLRFWPYSLIYSSIGALYVHGWSFFSSFLSSFGDRVWIFSFRTIKLIQIIYYDADGDDDEENDDDEEEDYDEDDDEKMQIF